jgi:hypothetical protein
VLLEHLAVQQGQIQHLIRLPHLVAEAVDTTLMVYPADRAAAQDITAAV